VTSSPDNDSAPVPRETSVASDGRRVEGPVLSEDPVAEGGGTRVEGPKPAGPARLMALAAWRGVGELYNSEGLTHAASISYYALLSMFPLMLLALTAVGEMTADAADRDAVIRFVFRYFPRQFGFISGQLEAFQTTPVTFGFWGIVALVWAALGVFNAITSAVNHAWAVEKRRSFLMHRLVGFLMMVSAGLLVMVGIVIASLVRIAETRLGEAMVLSPWLDNFSGVFASYLATALLIGCVALVLYFIPNTRVRFRDVWPGAILVGVLWRIALRLFAWYAADLATWNVVHGSIAAVVVFLLWIYVSAVILLYGVEMTASYARLQDASVRHTSMSKELQADPQ
jgi:membrane protein